ncbi:MAG: hypothetical protein A2133_09035 [Actinobacteria bacterium RBG_16_64_13]|nr:MAG: hypothetical protein A2133_09035 [Actinobacteria bacterium RBG_16_64_13]
MRVVIGGVASRHDLPLDRLDDLQLAVETLLAEEPEQGGALVLEVSTAAAGLRVRLEGLTNQRAKSALSASDSCRPNEERLLDVRLFLDTLVDGYRVVETTAGCFAVEMEKRAS